MKTFKKHLNEKLDNKKFTKIYNEERQLNLLAIKILELRQNLGISQTELARKAKITQQQLSKVENGINCNMTTFFKVCNALGLAVGLYKGKKRIS